MHHFEQVLARMHQVEKVEVLKGNGRNTRKTKKEANLLHFALDFVFICHEIEPADEERLVRVCVEAVAAGIPRRGLLRQGFVTHGLPLGPDTLTALRALFNGFPLLHDLIVLRTCLEVLQVSPDPSDLVLTLSLELLVDRRNVLQRRTRRKEGIDLGYWNIHCAESRTSATICRPGALLQTLAAYLLPPSPVSF